MAVVFANLGASSGTTPVAPDIRDLTDAISYTIPSWDPPNDGIVCLAIFSGENAGNIGITDVTGNGDVWTNVDTKSYLDSGTPTRTIDLFVAYGADLTTGATLIDFDPNTEIFCYVSIFHITGADEQPSQPADAFPNAFSGEGTGTGTGTIDLPAPISSGNRSLILVAHNANEAITNDAGYTKLDDLNGAGPAIGIITTCDEDGFADAAFTWTTSAAFGYIAFEVAESTQRLDKGYARLFGPAHLTTAETTLFEAHAVQRVEIRSIDINNPTGGTVTATFTVAGQLLIEVPIPAGESRNLRRYLANNELAFGDSIVGQASADSSLVCTINGYVRDA